MTDDNLILKDIKKELCKLYNERDLLWLKHQRLNGRVIELENKLSADMLKEFH
jgi:hypothetical protein